MTPYYADDWLTVYQGDCRKVMASMEPSSVHCVVTSPPYWGLRDYGTATWIGGDEFHEHVGTVMRTAPPGTPKQASNFVALSVSSGDCSCGAIREDGQLGLEPTPEAYVENMVAVFREIRRVLRDDGTVWLNLGDSYAGGPSSAGEGMAALGEQYRGGGHRAAAIDKPDRKRPAGLKTKDLVGIPWRVAFALQADGWYLRSDIIWAKPNPMPESVTDRPTKAHEYLFLLSKSPRYYYDGDAVREARDPAQIEWREKYAATIARWGQRREAGLNRGDSNSGLATQENTAGRNLRSVWSIATQPYPGAHFATFPEKLVEPCVKAGCPHPGVVLDPFAGSGTTGRVAQRLGRRAVLIDLSAAYLVQAMERNANIPLGLETS